MSKMKILGTVYASKSKKLIMKGTIPVYKPPGITSTDVTNRIRGILAAGLSLPEKQVKLGHGGTLDKEAEGVLVIGIGEDCKRLTDYLHGNKTYQTLGCLGVSTTTYDASGDVTNEHSYNHVTRDKLLRTLESFQGEQIQIPPAYSSLKFNGRRASDLVRSGQAVDMTTKKRTVTIYEINLLHFSLPHFMISVKCSSGTYIRSLVHDIGISCGTVAHVKYLCRTQQGPFTLKDSLVEDQWTINHFTNFLSITEGSLTSL